MLTVGPYQSESKVIVAPMAGVTDRPFRHLCRSFGAQWIVSEMVTSDVGLWRTDKSRRRLAYADEPAPRWIQIAGAEPDMMAQAAVRHVEMGAQIIDINMGCPAKKVCNRQAGSALLRDEALVEDIVRAVVEAVNVPVTLKIRLGWSRDQMNAVAIAGIAESAGIEMLTVHGRTRACRFKGGVDYDAIRQVKASVSLPVIANGDITTPAMAARVLDLTAADGVMLGRGVQGQPWLPAMVDTFLAGRPAKSPSQYEQVQAMLEHVKALAVFYQDIRIARKHLAWFLDHFCDDPVPLKRHFNSLESLDAQLAFLSEIKHTHEAQAA